MIHHTDSIINLMKAMLMVQGKVEGAPKDRVNPHFKNRYASLESVVDAIRQPCQEAGLVVIQAPGETLDGSIAVTTMLAHAESGEWLKSTIYLPMAKVDPQGAGSAISYASRYSLLAIFNLPAVDDDGEAASRPPQRRPEAAEPPAGNGFAHVVNRMLGAIASKNSGPMLEELVTTSGWRDHWVNLPDDQQERVVAAIQARREHLKQQRITA